MLVQKNFQSPAKGLFFNLHLHPSRNSSLALWLPFCFQFIYFLFSGTSHHMTFSLETANCRDNMYGSFLWQYNSVSYSRLIKAVRYYDLTSLICFSAKHPEIQTTAQEEVDRVLGDSSVVTSAMEKELKYVANCIKESQRLVPVITGFSRGAVEDAKFGGNSTSTV